MTASQTFPICSRGVVLAVLAPAGVPIVLPRRGRTSTLIFGRVAGAQSGACVAHSSAQRSPQAETISRRAKRAAQRFMEEPAAQSRVHFATGDGGTILSESLVTTLVRPRLRKSNGSGRETRKVAPTALDISPPG